VNSQNGSREFQIHKYYCESESGLGKNPGNSKKPMGMGKTGFYREKWEKREKLPFFKYMFKKHVKPLANN
jgi:hypothetical protein